MLDQGDRAVRAASEINKVITGSVTMPPSDMRLYLSDFEDPKRLLQFDDLAAAGGQFQVGCGEMGEKVLDGEPCGELQISPVKVSPGGESEFLPECYSALYEEGNILVPGL